MSLPNRICYLTKAHKAVKNESVTITALAQRGSLMPGLSLPTLPTYRQHPFSFLYIKAESRKRKKIDQKLRFLEIWSDEP